MDAEHIRLNYTGIMTTTACTLKCRLCSIAAPILFAQGQRIPFDRLVQTCDIYFRVVEHVRKFSLTGGEPLLVPQLAGLVDYLAQHYSHQFDALEIVTNGTIMPSQELLDALKKHKDKVALLVDHYGDLSPLAEKIGAVLTKNGVPNQVRTYFGEKCHCGGWVDFGDYSLKHPAKAEQMAIYKKCAFSAPVRKLGVCEFDGLFYTCGHTYLSMLAGSVEKSAPNFVDFLDPSKTIGQLRRELVELVEIECPSGCAYCNGMCEDSARYMPAEQMTDEMIRKAR